MGLWVGTQNRRNWWSAAEPKISGGEPFRLNNYMSRARFEGISGSLHYIDENIVEHNGGFFHIHKMEEEWNLNTSEEFNKSWINVLYKSMM